MAGLRALAVALLPAAAYLTGALRMFFEIGEAVARFATRLTFSPVVWAGVAVLGVAVLLLLVAAVLDRRGVGRRRPRRGAKAVPAAERAEPRGRKEPAAEGGTDPELDDIESLLRKHGIS